VLESESELLVLLPIKELSLAKERMKTRISPDSHEYIKVLVERTFHNTMLVVKKLGLSFGIVSPSDKILDRGKELGAVFTYQDGGTDLNGAIAGAIHELKHQDKWKSLLILMADLPLLTAEELERFINQCRKAEKVGILAAWKNDSIAGTCGLFLPLSVEIELFFGKDSYNFFKNYFLSQNINFIELASSPRLSCWDLDTLGDVLQIRDLIHVETIKKAVNDLLAILDREKVEERFLGQVT
jgi:2-phospho-L-lactate guanylyltransferase (CobY/MobA/RfbA family)